MELESIRVPFVFSDVVGCFIFRLNKLMPAQRGRADNLASVFFGRLLPLSTHVEMLAAHMVYGDSTDLATRWFRRKLWQR